MNHRNFIVRDLLLLFMAFIWFQCGKKAEIAVLEPHKEFIRNITENEDFFYSVIKPDPAEPKNDMAIGVFDSGIGGLTVFDAIVNADFFNSSHENYPDSVKDFLNEQFIYLADQANMPYSNYVEEDNRELLEEHILKDALFLLNNKYHVSSGSIQVSRDKPHVKAVVMACNTATAYGKSHVEELCRLIDAGIKVIGVIDAGCKGALDVVKHDKDATIAVFATPATVSSMAYVNALEELKKEYGVNIHIIQQGGKGLHESIDNKPDFIGKQYFRPYAQYQGPSLQNEQYKIQKSLLPYYNFDTTGYQMLVNKDRILTSDTIAINSIENYVRYHMVTMVEQLKQMKKSPPLRAVVLGCTHYPLVSDIIHEVLAELRQTDRYNRLIADTCHLIDPALNTAKELYVHLSEQQLFSNSKDKRIKKSLFFITVPNKFEKGVEIAPEGGFTYEFQYKKRNVNQMRDFTLVVPLTGEVISDEQMGLIRNRLPYTYELLRHASKAF